MPRITTILPISILALLGAVVYPVLHDLTFITIGVGRHVQKVSEFPFKCRRITDSALQACEDMWLDENSRQLFLACSDPASRKQWMPNLGEFNISGRGLDDHIIAMDIDRPNGRGFAYRIVKPTGFDVTTTNDGRLYALSVSGTTSSDGQNIQLYLINNKPSYDAVTGQFLDNSATGANTTVEVFETGPNASTMRHLRTFAHAQIASPNNIAITNDGGFYFTNDHGPHKTGVQFHLSQVLGTGDVSYCSPTIPTTCTTLAGGYRFPNGLMLSKSDGHLYVPSAITGGIVVYRLSPNDPFNLTKVHKIALPYPIDNLSEDRNGVIYAAAFPDVMALLRSDDPFGPVPPSAAFRVRTVKAGEEYLVEKVIEDGDGELLPTSTTVVHDAKTGRLFLSGVVAPFITVCEKA